MTLLQELLGCTLLELDRSYWAVRLTTGEWVCEARIKTDVYKGVERHFDWSNDLVATGDVDRITQLWLLCPPSKTSPLGNTACLDITEPGTAFQLKLATVDSNIVGSVKLPQAHIIGRVTNKETGACECFIWDEYEQGLLTPETMIYDPVTGGARRDQDGNLEYAGRTNINHFHSWRSSLAPPGRLELRTVGVRV